SGSVTSLRCSRRQEREQAPRLLAVRRRGVTGHNEAERPVRRPGKKPERMPRVAPEKPEKKDPRDANAPMPQRPANLRLSKVDPSGTNESRVVWVRPLRVRPHEFIRPDHLKEIS